ncbi:CPBP family intramembrane glutamic endopeptidase [Marinibacterium profundimaris]|uniref:CAAX prenyl protease 2/Lysostaphin resistance protein A-like domain-containing protein n=1 Tax=Marinibacterium profundimaris TaxID=1679460 RepID=A0A225NHQ4_9RHOB|nr:CPBP family intramembrane glutamic endopeptidase [Marinibacterium profundimaris]OWU73274.1 hypothetical protein ATO3_11265 [Marinibacterium profundimaris]
MTPPNWKTALGIYCAYAGLILSIRLAIDLDNGKPADVGMAYDQIVLPQLIGALFLASAVTQLVWWAPILTERRRGHPRWMLPILLALMIAAMLLNAIGVQWSALAPLHLGLLAFAALLMGVSEEVLTRGVIIVGLRGSRLAETWVWPISTLLFVLVQLPTRAFVYEMRSVLVQAVVAFMMGTGLYLVRRLNGGLIAPILVHAGWDLFPVAQAASGGNRLPGTTVLQNMVYGVSMGMVAIVLVQDHRTRRDRLSRRS